VSLPAAIHPLPFTWPYAPVFWLVVYWVFIPEYRLTLRAKEGAARADSPDRGSLKLILLTNQFAGMAAFAVCWIAATAVPPAWRVPSFWIGIGMFVSGGLLRRHCFRILGEFFTGDVNARPEQPVIDRGAYRWIRHPSYTAGMLLFTGIGVALGNWLSMIIMAGTMAIVYTYRVRVEEQTLLKTLGEPYRKFMQTRKRFIPYVF
jgi:protein-S-isoprenylcysteine O-methyltransferase Ste14